MPGTSPGHDVERSASAHYSVFMGHLATKIKQRAAPAAASRPALLLDWYDRHRRRLPWRPLAGGPADAHRGWLSEGTLQQTGGKKGGPHFGEFLGRLSGGA